MVMTPRRHKWGKAATARANFGFYCWLPIAAQTRIEFKQLLNFLSIFTQAKVIKVHGASFLIIFEQANKWI